MSIVDRHKRGSFNGATPTNASEAADYRAKVYDSLCEIDTYTDNVFTCRVVTEPRIISNQPVINSPYTIEGRRIIDSSNAFVQIKFRGQLVAHDILTPHLLLPDLCDASTLSDPKSIANFVNCSTMFIDCVSPAAYDGEVPMMGDLVKVTLKPGDAGPVDCQTCYFEDIEFLSSHESNSIRSTVYDDCGEKLAELYNAALTLAQVGAVPGGSAKVASDMARLLSEGKDMPTDVMVESQMNAATQTRLVSTAVAQAAYWKDRTEDAAEGPNGTDTNEYRLLALYWTMTFLNEGQTPASQLAAKVNNNIFKSNGQVQHWSAVYISYLIINAFGGVEQSKQNFAASSAHYYYLTGSKTKKWTAYKLLGATGKIKAQVGDILITVYNGANRETPNTHGDVVWKVEGGYAYLTGGNVGDSITMSRVVALDSEGFYTNTKAGLKSPRVSYPYLTVMKYRAKESRYSPAAVAAANTEESSEG